MFSKACEYAIKSVIFITKNSLESQRVNLNEIAREIDSPVAFTAKTLQQLAKASIILSKKGPSGGFEISTDQVNKLTLNRIVDVIDGDKIYRSCGLGLKKCDAKKPCPLHDDFMVLRTQLKRMLEKTKVKSLGDSYERGVTFLKR